ncbi:hypothetical protein HQ520_10530 [bacterium]|nr:hypothetical protein [bacterium]
MAVIKYRQVLQEAPDSEQRERILLQLGNCFFNEQFRSLHDAHEAYLRYTIEYPQGFYIDEAQRSLDRIRAILANRDEVDRAQKEVAAKTVEELTKLIEQNPYDADLSLRLGNALWELERYDEAVKAYLKSTEINAWLQEHDLIRKRLMVNEDGDVIPVTPEKERELERESNPLIVSNLNEYHSRLKATRDGQAGEVFYNVTGIVHNRGSQFLRRAEVEVRFYNAAREILDVKVAQVGNMPPGAIRGFSLRATNYDNIYNITSYEAIPHWE